MINPKSKRKNLTGILFRGNTGILLILLLSLLVRLWGIDFGLPYFFHFDESTTIYSAFYAAANRLQPHFFLFPMLYPYLLLVLYIFYFIAGLILGVWYTPFQFFVSYVNDPSPFLLLGRLLTASFGVLTVWAVYWIGKKLYGVRVGLLAAFFLALTFLHVQESHYIKQDVLTGLLSLLAFYLSVLCIKKGLSKNYIFLGAVLGLFASLKYNFFILAPMIILSYFAKPNKKIFYMFLILVLVFFVLNPYIALEWKQAYLDIISQSKLTTVQWVDSGNLPIWLYNITYHLRYGLGLPLLFLSLVGIFYLFFTKKIQNALLISTPISFFLTLAFFGGTNFARYNVMIVPELALIAAIVVSKIRNRFWLITVSILAISIPLSRIIKFDYYITRPDTRALAKEWIEGNITPGARIFNEGAALNYYPSVYGPPLLMDVNSLELILKAVRKKGQNGYFLQALIAANNNRIGYNLLQDSKNACYLVTTSWPKGETINYGGEHKLIKEFISNPLLLEDPHAWRVDFKRLDEVKVFDKNVVAGPIIRIYQMKEENCNGFE